MAPPLAPGIPKKTVGDGLVLGGLVITTMVHVLAIVDESLMDSPGGAHVPYLSLGALIVGMGLTYAGMFTRVSASWSHPRSLPQKEAR